MVEKSSRYIVRLSAEGGETVRAALLSMGKDGEAALKELEKGVVKVDTQMTALTRTILRRVVPSITAGGLMYAVRGAVKDLGDLKDMAEKVGVSAEELQVFREMGREVGLGVGEADAAVQKFVKGVGEAQAGTGKLLPLLREYGIAVKDASGNNREWDDVLADVAEAIRLAADDQERLYIATKAFGDEGAAFLIALKKGGKALEDFQQHLRDTGTLFSNEMVDKADEFDKAWEQVMKKWERRWKGLVLSAAYAIQQSTRLVGALAPYTMTGGGQGSGGAGAPPPGGNQGANNEMFGPYQVYGPAASPQEKALPVPPRMPDKRVSKDIGDQNKAREEAIRLAQAEAEKTRSVMDALKFRNEQMMRSAELQDVYNQLRAAGVDLSSEEGQAIQELVAQHHEFLRAQEDQKRASESVKRQWEEQRKSAERMGDAVNDLITDFDDLGSVARKVLADLAQSAIQMGSGGSATGGIGGILAEAIFGGGGLFGGSSKGATIYDYPAGPYLPGRAGGGPVDAGRDYVVGERGPEILRMGNRGGTIVPNHAVSGTGGPVVNIDARGADPAGLARVENLFRSLDMKINRIDGSFEARAAAAASQAKKRALNYMR